MLKDADISEDRSQSDKSIDNSTSGSFDGSDEESDLDDKPSKKNRLYASVDRLVHEVYMQTVWARRRARICTWGIIF